MYFWVIKNLVTSHTGNESFSFVMRKKASLISKYSYYSSFWVQNLDFFWEPIFWRGAEWPTITLRCKRQFFPASYWHLATQENFRIATLLSLSEERKWLQISSLRIKKKCQNNFYSFQWLIIRAKTKRLKNHHTKNSRAENCILASGGEQKKQRIADYFFFAILKR